MKALILTGGKSSRMGQDKAQLKIGDQTLLERTIDLAHTVTGDVYLSIAHDDDRQQPLPTIRDLEPSPGPLGGLQAAFKNDPDSRWLLLACDLPRLSKLDIAHISECTKADVVCLLNPLDNHPEPLCAVYSPEAAPKLEAAIASNQRCARRFLKSLIRDELEPEDPQALLNLNRPEHIKELDHLHRYGTMEKSVTVEYFAKLSQESGMNSEKVRTSAATLTGLWEEVRLRHHFTLDLPHIKPAINNEFANWETPLKESDTVAFMPPFAGG